MSTRLDYRPLLEKFRELAAKRLGMVKAGMERLGSRKETMPDGSWYWNLKPDLRAGEAFEL